MYRDSVPCRSEMTWTILVITAAIYPNETEFAERRRLFGSSKDSAKNAFEIG